MTRLGQGKASVAPYKPEPQKNVALTEEQARQIKERLCKTRRTIEDVQIDREVEEKWSGVEYSDER